MTAAPLPALYCASCGAPAASRVVGHACTYCQSPLVPAGHPHPAHCQRCRHCTAANSPTAHFCGRCGEALDPHAPQVPMDMPCPGCGHQPMERWFLLQHQREAFVAGCSNCGGCWLPHPTFEALKSRALHSFEQGSEPLVPAASAVRRRSLAGVKEPVVYRQCPECHQGMARRNFAHASGVIIDSCRDHGTFFDAGELEDILDFVQSGGLALVRERRLRERAQSLPSDATSAMPRFMAHSDSSQRLEIAWEAICAFVHWAQTYLEKTLDLGSD